MTIRLPLLSLLICGALACGAGKPTPDASTPACVFTTFEEKLRCLPGVVSVTSADAGVTGYARFDIGLEQPVDHFGDAGVFTQRLTLLHRNTSDPMVLSTSGYFLSSRRRELTVTYETNQIAYEHRFFATSTPEPRDFRYNTMRQVAADAHRIVETFKPLYPKPWVSTGGSRGGMTSVYHRRHYPDDVTGTVAYVAPICDSVADARYPAFLAQVGKSSFAACRQQLIDLQRALLTRRAEVLPLIDASLTFNKLGVERMYEHAAIESFFAFWQYTNPNDSKTGCSSLPSPMGTAQELHDFVETQVGWAYFSDEQLDQYAGYYHAAAIEEGGPKPYEADIADLLTHPGTDIATNYSPVTTTYDAAPQQDVTQWVEQSGERFLFIYGELDPWSAGQYRVTPSKDNAVLTVAGGNHGSSISSLAATDQDTAKAMLTRWFGKTPVRKLTRSEGEAAEPRERWPR